WLSSVLHVKKGRRHVRGDTRGNDDTKTSAPPGRGHRVQRGHGGAGGPGAPAQCDVTTRAGTATSVAATRGAARRARSLLFHLVARRPANRRGHGALDRSRASHDVAYPDRRRPPAVGARP